MSWVAAILVLAYGLASYTWGYRCGSNDADEATGLRNELRLTKEYPK